MKHILIVNPAAGHKNALPLLQAEVERLSKTYDVSLYETEGKRAATAFVKKTAEALGDQPVRFYACGGDGTLQEVISGAVGLANVSVSCYPCGSGNDFVKYYGGAANFLSLEALFEGTTRKIDLLTDGERYAVNAANFGFDYEVLRTMEKVRRYPLLGGKRAYYAGVATCLFNARKNRARVYADGALLDEDDCFLLCTVANGTYIGGSYMCAPRSDNEDGLLELCYVKSLSVPKFLSMIGSYKRGEHLDAPALKDHLHYRRVKKVEVCSEQKNFGYALDGEMTTSSHFTLSICPGAIDFAIPQNSLAFLAGRKARRGAEEPSLV